MTIQDFSYINASGYYNLNDLSFDSRLLFTDTNSQLYYMVIKFDNKDSIYKVISNGLLNGYDNNTNYSYRFDFDRFINIENIRKPEFTAPSNERVLVYNSMNYNNLTLVLNTADIFESNDGNFIFKDNGEIWLNVDFPSDLSYNILCNDYTFLDKKDSINTIFSTTPVIYTESWIPITNYNISTDTSYLKQDSAGRNYLNDSSCPLLSATDTGYGYFEKIQTEEDDFYQVTPDLNKVVSMYKGGIVMDGSHYVNSIWVRHTNGAAMTIQIYNDMNPGASSKITTVKPNVWTLISTNYFWGEGYGNIIIAAGTQNVPLDYKFLKIEKGHTATNWTPSFEDYIVSFLTYNSSGLPVTRQTFNKNQIVQNRLTYISSDSVSYYYHSPIENRFGDIIKNNCKVKQLFYNGINGNFDMLYTTANEHEVINSTKEYVKIGDNQYPISITNQKQLKLNTGFGLNQEQLYSLIKSPYVFKISGGELEMTGRNLALNTSDFININHWDSFGELPAGQVSVTTNENIKCLYFNRNNTTANSSYILAIQVLPNILKKNTNYTLSFMYKNTGHIGNVYVYSPAFTNLLRTDLPISQGFKHFEWTFNTGPGTNMYLIRFDCIGAGLSSASELFLYDIKLEEGSVFTGYSKSLEDQNLLIPSFKKYKLNTSSFEGYIGSKLSERNVELLLEDDKTYKRRSNINLDFWE